MKRALLAASGTVVVATAIFISSAAFVLAANLLPAPTGYVNDFAKVLSSGTKTQLESEFSQFNASTSNEIAVVTVQSMNGDYIEHYAAQLFKEWGIGTKKNDTGVLLLLSISDRKLRIEVGYGLEGALPDSTAASIIADMTPLLKQNNYDGAVTLGTREIIAATKGEYVANTNTSKGLGGISVETIFTIFALVLVLLQWLAAMLARSKTWWAGGILGGVVGVGLATVFGWWLLLGLGATALLFLVGLLLDLLVSKAYDASKSSGALPPWWAGGTKIGGGSSSGGFGGFGGGSSGGGGASGGW